MMLDHVEKLGIKTIFNTKVTGYFEEETGAGVTLANGETLTADLIVAADGLHSTSWKIVNREKVRAKPSGYSVYRTSFPADVALTDPIVSQRWKQDIDAGKQVFQFFLGPDCHANVLFSKETVCWTLVHRVSSIECLHSDTSLPTHISTASLIQPISSVLPSRLEADIT